MEEKWQHCKEFILILHQTMMGMGLAGFIMSVGVEKKIIKAPLLK